MVGKDIAAQTMKILKENRFTSTSEEIIATVESIILRINGEIVELHFDFNNAADDDIRHLDSIVRACDETLISRDGYRRLAQAIPNLTREHVIEKCRNEITKSMKILVPIKSFNICSAAINNDNYGDESQQNTSEVEFDDEEVGNGAYRSIISLLDIIVPILTTSTSPVLKIGDKINIRISGDGRNVGRKQKHVMLTMCILNEGEMVLNPTH